MMQIHPFWNNKLYFNAGRYLNHIAIRLKIAFNVEELKGKEKKKRNNRK